MARSKQNDHVRHLGLLNGIALVLGIQIGSGLFSSPSLVVRNTGSEQVALLVWIAAGLLAWTCASVYIELGIRLPYNGGPQEYLSHCFSDTFDCVASWATIFIIKPCSAAMLSLVIAEHICNAIHSAQSDYLKYPLAFMLITFVAAINCISNRASHATTKAALTCKILGISTIVLSGLAYFSSQGGLPQPKSGHEASQMPRHLGNYRDAVLSAMWAYSGWETLSFVGGELKDSSRNTSRVINSSMTAVLILYCLVNLAYFSVLSMTEIVSSNTIALVRLKMASFSLAKMILSTQRQSMTASTLEYLVCLRFWWKNGPLNNPERV
ncbi:uncharacterized protein PV06_04147 [Exophiala oligosperma]|uniref:Amino acid permease/ SLC12A domain-containing protein n=1 Tax=Exophiala oligosperma TaxID=215243 RepID=A0A0D2C7J8_9EURO|nr:uncharacterized protein PV06_04147 [Exophiala oligosperma]KIW45792.1 hypothetical protein PV06_04147 [Exophiala oligosperma]